MHVQNEMREVERKWEEKAALKLANGISLNPFIFILEIDKSIILMVL